MSKLFAAIALLTPAEVQLGPPNSDGPPVYAQDEYISELPKAGITAEMFSRPTKPRANIVALFSTEDYLLESLRNSEQGVVAVVPRVGADGRLADCIVAQSSGFPALDSQTCRVLWQRARFTPARDSGGHAVESAWRQKIRWELPPPEPMPIEKWSMRLTLDFVQDGGVLNCNVEASGAMAADQRSCDFFLTFSDGLAKLRAAADYPQWRVTMETQFSPDETMPKQKAPAGMRLFARQVTRLTIDESGKPLQCRVIEAEGPDAVVGGCNDLLAEVFERPGIKAGAIEATLARYLYLPE